MHNLESSKCPKTNIESISTVDSVKRIVGPWFSTKEAAMYLSLSEGTLRNLTSNGKMPYYKLLSENRYLKEELDQIILEQKRGIYHGN